MGDDREQPASSHLAQRIVARESDRKASGKPEISGAALHRACERVTHVLCDTVGEKGCHALLARAFARTEHAHPALHDFRPVNGGGVRLENIVASMTARSTAEVTSAIEALLAALIDVLSRLIGEDLATQLMNPDDGKSPSGNGAPAS